MSHEKDIENIEVEQLFRDMPCVARGQVNTKSVFAYSCFKGNRRFLPWFLGG